jgi:hypothetical protein
MKRKKRKYEPDLDEVAESVGVLDPERRFVRDLDLVHSHEVGE